eukprot:5568258-Ditylum_brightwellii.AAC.1
MGGMRDCHLLQQKVDQRHARGRTAHARAQCLGSTGLKKQLATYPGNCCGKAIQAAAAFVAALVVFFLHEDSKQCHTIAIGIKNGIGLGCDDGIKLGTMLGIKDGIKLG